MAAESIQISMRGLAEVSATAPKRKQTVLRRFKFKKSDESVGRSNYYVKALSAIKRHHKGDHVGVQSILKDLLTAGLLETDTKKRAKLLNNHRAITDYLKNFGNRDLTICPGKRLYFVSEDVVVSAQPDMVVEENGQMKLFKLNMGKDDYVGGVGALMLHTMHEAAAACGLGLESNYVECLEVSSGNRVVGPQSGFPPKKVIEDACKELSDLWNAA
ncbi:hypothetical protein ACFQBQ_13515 [Granulicella cerasi]|uniref:Uncharacterized protein n=1 Tax=Granulicella cerasi TaxID=741063 RepID=A0ABW1ZAS0_9BACT|nr:hypothetical protein [Granulicella cerasi]